MKRQSGASGFWLAFRDNTNFGKINWHRNSTATSAAMQRKKLMKSSISRREFAVTCGCGTCLCCLGMVNPLQAQQGWQDYLKDLAREAARNAKIKTNLRIDGDVSLYLDGLKAPVLSWQWFAANLAIGALQSVGAIIFGKFLSAIFGDKNLEDLLRNQLIEFARIVKQSLQENDLRNYMAKLAAVKTVMNEYVNEKEPRGKTRIDYATTASAELVELLKSLGFLGYQGYFSAAGMRIAILQERAKLNASEEKNIAEAKLSFIQHHKTQDDDILLKTSVEYHVKKWQEKYPRGVRGDVDRPPQMRVVEDVFGKGLIGKGLTEVKWDQIRDEIRSQTTQFGEKIINLWGFKRTEVTTSKEVRRPVFGIIGREPLFKEKNEEVREVKYVPIDEEKKK